jgi:diadenosine tetraphosphate (Ap4A) HIT family hydrolase
MRDPNNPCLFCTTKEEEIIEENEFAYATFDSYPVSSKHCLIVPKRHIKDYFELNENEVTGCDQLIKIIKNQIEKDDKTVKGFNIGVNSGKVAGQSIMHCHIHLIPRREGDVENPQGGVRGVIPLKQHYTRKNK